MSPSALRANAFALGERLVPLWDRVKPTVSTVIDSGCPPRLHVEFSTGHGWCFRNALAATLIRGATRACCIVPFGHWVHRNWPSTITMGLVCAVLILGIPKAYAYGQTMMRRYPDEIELWCLWGPFVDMLVAFSCIVYCVSIYIQKAVQKHDAVLILLVVVLFYRAHRLYAINDFTTTTMDLLKTHYAPDGLAWTHPIYRADGRGRDFWFGYRYGEEQDPVSVEKLEREWGRLRAIAFE